MLPESDGDWHVKRYLPIPSLKGKSQAEMIKQILLSKEGVSSVSTQIDKGRIAIDYDARQVSFHQIVEMLDRENFSVLQNGWFRLRRYWYEYTEGNLREAARAAPKACCNRPPLRPNK